MHITKKSILLFSQQLRLVVHFFIANAARTDDAVCVSVCRCLSLCVCVCVFNRISITFRIDFDFLYIFFIYCSLLMLLFSLLLIRRFKQQKMQILFGFLDFFMRSFCVFVLLFAQTTILVVILVIVVVVVVLEYFTLFFDLF